MQTLVTILDLQLLGAYININDYLIYNILHSELQWFIKFIIIFWTLTSEFQSYVFVNQK
jgi:hypothetical protein